MNSVEAWSKEKYGDCTIEITTLENNDIAKSAYTNLGYTPVRITMRKHI
jgi:hypothetical protein